MDYELYVEGDKKVIDIFTNQLRKFGLNAYAFTIEHLWKIELKNSLIDAMTHNSNIVLPVSFFEDEATNIYLRLEHEYVVLNSGSTYISTLRLCNKIENGVFNEIVLYSVYCKPSQKDLQ